jgi:hypothetical protein
MKSTVVWDVAPYSLVEVYLRFEESYYLHPEGRGVDTAIITSLLHGCLFVLLLDTEEVSTVSSETKVNL